MNKQSSVASISKLVSKKNLEDEEEKQTYWVEYLVALAASFTFGMFGVHCGWFGPTYVKLMDPTSELYIKSSESAWLAGFLQVGAIPGPFIGSYITNKFGRQKAILATTVPNLISFLLVFFATNVSMLFVSRFFAGIATGITFVVLPVYTSEIASPKIRGKLGLLTGIIMPVVTLIEYMIIPAVSVKENAIIIIAFIIFQGVIFSILPESPHFLMSKEEEDKAEQALMILRQKKDVSEELKKLKISISSQVEQNYIESVKTTVNCKAFYILLGTMLAQQFSGLVAIFSYIPVIFEQAHTSITPQTCIIITQITGIVMGVCGAFIIEISGRRPLFMISTSLAALSTGMLGAYFFLDKIDGISNFAFVPLVSIIIFVIGSGLGLISIPHLFVGELFTTNCRAGAGSIISILGSVFGLVVTLLYQFLNDYFGMAIAFWVLAGFNICSFIFGIFCIPETKGRSLQEIQDDLNSNKGFTNKISPSINNNDNSGYV